MRRLARLTVAGAGLITVLVPLFATAGCSKKAPPPPAPGTTAPQAPDKPVMPGGGPPGTGKG